MYQEFEECEGAPGQAQPARPAGQEECQAWLARLCAQWQSRSQDALFKLLRGSSGKAGDRTVRVASRARRRSRYLRAGWPPLWRRGWLSHSVGARLQQGRLHQGSGSGQPARTCDSN